MAKPVGITEDTRVPIHLATRYARGRLLLWIVISALTIIPNPEILRLLPRGVFAIWAGWVACSSLLVIALEYVLAPVRRHWLDAAQGCIDIVVIGIVTWYLGAAPHMMAVLLALPTVSGAGWMPRAQAALIVVAASIAMLCVIAMIAAGIPVPPPIGTTGWTPTPRPYLVAIMAAQAGFLMALSYFQFSAVRVARDRRARWQRLFDSAPDSIFVLDRNATLVRMNSAARRLAAGSAYGSVGADAGLVIAPDDRERATAEFNRALDGSQTSYEARTIHVDGSLGHVLVSNAPMIEDGVITGVLSIVHDITEMREAEAERRHMVQSLDQHRRLLQSIVSTVPTYLYVLDLRLRYVTFANDALLQTLGYSLEELSRLSREARFALYHPDDVALLQQTIRGLRQSSAVRTRLEYRIKGHDGAWRWLSDRVTVFERDADGMVTRLLGSAIDITEQKRVSAQLQASDELYRTLIENYPGGAVLLFDTNARLLLAEGRGLRDVELSASDLVGRAFGEPLTAEATAVMESRVRAALRGAEQQFELRFADKTFDIRAVPVRDAEGTIRFGMALTLDVTERRRLEADVRQAQKMEAVGTLAGGIAHDFNNILASVIGYAELAMLDAESDELQSDLGQVLTAAARGRQMVNRILAFSRRSSDELHTVEVGPIVSETLRLLRPTLPTGVTVDFSVDGMAPPVLGDAGQLHQVILNLCGNALYAMRDTGGTLTVRLSRTEALGQPYLRIDVVDSGVGMSPEVLERAIDPFFTTKPPEEGTGMGLAMVHGIVTAMGGVFRLESAPGHGTVAVIELPADVGRPTPVVMPGLTVDTPTGTERVMIVDDEAAVATFHSNALTRFGYRTAVFTNAAQALDCLRDASEPFDLIITDMTMPHLSGEDLLRESLQLRPATPVVICTGFSASMTPERAAELGAAGYLNKPLSVHDLVMHVRRILDRDPVAIAHDEG